MNIEQYGLIIPFNCGFLFEVRLVVWATKARQKEHFVLTEAPPKECCLLRQTLFNVLN